MITALKSNVYGRGIRDEKGMRRKEDCTVCA